MDTVTQQMMQLLSRAQNESGRTGFETSMLWPIVGGVVGLAVVGAILYAVTKRDQPPYYQPGYQQPGYPPPGYPPPGYPPPAYGALPPGAPPRANPDQSDAHLSWDENKNAWRLHMEDGTRWGLRAELKYDFARNKLFARDSARNDVSEAAAGFLAGHGHAPGSYSIAFV